MRNVFPFFKSLRILGLVCTFVFAAPVSAAGLDSLSSNDTASGLKEALTRGA